MNDVKLIQKAWLIWDPTSPDWQEWYDKQRVYADTRQKARGLCDEMESYLTVKAIRDKGNDKVEYHGEKIIRYIVAEIKNKEDRKAKILTLPEDCLYFIQDSRCYVGNSMLLWGIDGNGYVCDPNKAQQYTKADLIKKSLRSTDVIWLAVHLLGVATLHIDSQKVNHSIKI